MIPVKVKSFFKKRKEKKEMIIKSETEFIASILKKISKNTQTVKKNDFNMTKQATSLDLLSVLDVFLTLYSSNSVLEIPA